LHAINYVLDKFINGPVNNNSYNNNNGLEKAESSSSLKYDTLSNIQESTQKTFELLTLNIKINKCNFYFYNI